MWAFGYGSLMWDGWEQKYSGTRLDRAVLRGFHRSFNKASTSNWGSPTHPGPTLGLEQNAGDAVVGVAFEFSERRRAAILAELASREGRSFTLEVLGIS